MAVGLPECGPDERLLPINGGELPPLIPSKINIWRARRVDGGRYTRIQINHLADRGLDPAQVEDVIVRQRISDREIWAPSESRPTYLMPCPILAHRRRAGLDQFKVISPRGDHAWVYADPSRPGFASIRRTEWSA